MANKNKKEKFGFWLSIITILLLLIHPTILVLGGIFILIDLLSFTGYNDLITYQIFTSIISFILGAFSFIVGLNLWKRNKKAPELAKIYLIINFILSIIFYIIDNYFLSMYKGLEEYGYGWGGMGPIFGSLIWLWYFNVSKKVKKIYGHSKLGN